jgi:phosphoribosylanthranilate isomerase
MALDIKICGLTNVEDAQFAAEQGADYLGFVFHAGSPRYVTPAAVRGIVAVLPSATRCVGVFVNAPRVAVERVAADCRLHAVQLHGAEGGGEFRDLPVPVWRAVCCRQDTWTPDPRHWTAERYVVDAAAGVYGGSGEKADWNQAALLGRRYPIMLAGGLTAANVAEAIARVRPVGVDVSSGVEASPGRKDPRKVAAFIAAAQGAVSNDKAE